MFFDGISKPLESEVQDMTQEELLRAIEERNSVRQYTPEPISPEHIAALDKVIADVNAKFDLNIQLMIDDPGAFQSLMAKAIQFKNVNNYIAFVGHKRKNLEEVVGYAGERIILEAQHLGLKTCWVALTFNKSQSKAILADEDVFVCSATIGYGENDGVRHESKEPGEIYKCVNPPPEWFLKGINAALRAPSAYNMQNFTFGLAGKFVTLTAPNDHYSQLNKGIAKYHFEVAAGKEHFHWVDEPM